MGRRKDFGNATMNQSEMREEYDFSKGVRGKYAAAAVDGTNVVRRDDVVADELNGPSASNS